jgi:hypothetical protein
VIASARLRALFVVTDLFLTVSPPFAFSSDMRRETLTGDTVSAHIVEDAPSDEAMRVDLDTHRTLSTIHERGLELFGL